MSQRYVSAKPANISAVLSPEIRLNFDALVTHFAGPTPPSDPQTGWVWLDTSDILNRKLNMYFDGAWHVILNNLNGPFPANTSMNTYVHTQAVAAVSWTVNHNLTSKNLIIQIWDSLDNLFIPDTVNLPNSNQAVVGFNSAKTGRAIVLG